MTVDQALPTLPPVPDAGVPAALIRRRPDLRQAERNLAASVADVGVATAELYPKFRISGLFALESVDSDNLFEAASRTWSIGPGVSVPLFNAGRLRALREVEQAQVDAAVSAVGDDSGAILIQSIGGGGGNGGFSVAAGAAGGGVGAGAVSVGLGGSGGAGGAGGTVIAEINGAVSTEGDRASGVVAQSIGGGGGKGGLSVNGTESGGGIGCGSV